MNRITITMSALSLVLPGLTAADLRADEMVIRKGIADYVDAFNQKDLDAVSGMWAVDAIHVDRETGERTEGRDAMKTDIAAVFKEQPDTRLAVRVDRVRLIKPDVARVEGQASVGSSGGEPAVSAFSAVLVQEGEKWLIDSIEEMPLPQPSSPYDALRDLEWLVGRWVDDSDPGRVDTMFRWSADRGFLLRSFVVQSADGVAAQGTQVIGWDPRSREIRSWTFNSDGSFGDATWSKNGDDWLIKSSQTLSDGQAASGTFVLTRVDDNTLTLQLIGHELEGEPQPAGKTATVVRVPESEQAAVLPQDTQ